MRRLLRTLALTLAAFLALFAWNGLNGSWRAPTSGKTLHGERRLGQDVADPGSFTVMAWNIAKCDFHERRLTFRSQAEVRAHLDAIAAVVVESQVDLLFLSEVVLEALPCQVNQVAYLAEKAGFAHWAYGDNYSFGFPGARIRSGNALLSKFPMQPSRVEQLPGGTPFWKPTGNRRLLWCDVTLGEEQVACASLRNDSFDLGNNAAQVQAILGSLPPGPALIAGDFNATPETDAFQLWQEAGRFAGVFDGPLTFPANAPNRRLDGVLLPKAWMERRGATWTDSVLDVDLSDHEPVVVRVQLGGH